MAHHHLSYNDKSLTFLSDDPICSSQGCKFTHLWGDASENEKEDITDYKAPAGLDPDIKATMASERLAAEQGSQETSFPNQDSDYIYHKDHPKWF